VSDFRWAGVTGAFGVFARSLAGWASPQLGQVDGWSVRVAGRPQCGQSSAGAFAPGGVEGGIASPQLGQVDG